MRPPSRKICAASSQSRGPCPAITVRPSGTNADDFNHRLRRARGHHTRQRPAGNRKRPLQRTGRKDHALRLDKGGGAPDRDGDLQVAVEAPDRGAMDDFGVARAQRLHEIGTHPIVRAQLIALGHRRRGDGAKHLAAGTDVLVEQQGRQTGFGGGRSGREARRPGADHHDIIVFALGSHSHFPISRLPF
ncbi:hypothetical protein ACVWW4_006691 [Bradyrhizobium sp. LB7.1]